MEILIGIILFFIFIIWITVASNEDDKKENNNFSNYQSTEKIIDYKKETNQFRNCQSTEKIIDKVNKNNVEKENYQPKCDSSNEEFNYVCPKCFTISRRETRCKKCGYEFSYNGLIQKEYKSIELLPIKDLECPKCSKINSRIRIRCTQCGYYFNYKDLIQNEDVNIDDRILNQITTNKELVNTKFIWDNKICVLEIHSCSYGKVSIVTDIIDTMNSHTRLGHNEYGYFILFTLNEEDIKSIETYIKENLKNIKSRIDSKIDVVCYIPQIGNQNNNLNIEKIFINKPIRNCTKQLLSILEKYKEEISLEKQSEKRETTDYYGRRVGFDYDFETYVINARHSK